MNEPTKLPCDQVIARLWEYIDGELTPESAERVRTHLDLCQRCYPQYDFQSAFRTFLQKQAAQPVPAELRQRVFEQLLKEEQKPAG